MKRTLAVFVVVALAFAVIPSLVWAGGNDPVTVRKFQPDKTWLGKQPVVVLANGMEVGQRNVSVRVSQDGRVDLHIDKLSHTRPGAPDIPGKDIKEEGNFGTDSFTVPDGNGEIKFYLSGDKLVMEGWSPPGRPIKMENTFLK